jgi:Zn ribbon nucleic-acid-binding protein
MVIIEVDRKKEKMKSIETTNHWNDRYYESTECLECGKMEIEKTFAELREAVANHTC